jgi:hypothetical protein
MSTQLFNEEAYGEAQKLVLPKHISVHVYACFLTYNGHMETYCLHIMPKCV